MSIDFQIMWNRLIAVVEEQATTIVTSRFAAIGQADGSILPERKPE